MEIVNLGEKFGRLHDYWNPRIAGELNDSYASWSNSSPDHTEHGERRGGTDRETGGADLEPSGRRARGGGSEPAPLRRLQEGVSGCVAWASHTAVSRSTFGVIASRTRAW